MLSSWKSFYFFKQVAAAPISFHMAIENTGFDNPNFNEINTAQWEFRNEGSPKSMLGNLDFVSGWG